MTNAGFTRALFAGMAVVISAVPASAQTVSGVVRDARGVVVSGVLVSAEVVATGEEVARVLSDAAGTYRIVLPAAGTYRLKTLRIGYRPVTSGPLSLGAGERRTQDLNVFGVPLSLDTVRVASRATCRVAADTSMLTYALWEQVRGAVVATLISGRSRPFAANAVVFTRSLNPTGRVNRGPDLAARVRLYNPTLDGCIE